MKPRTEKRLSRFEKNALAYLALLYALLSAVGSIFKIPGLDLLTSDPRVLVPMIAFFLYFLSRNLLGVSDYVHKLSDDIEKLAPQTGLLFQANVDSTHAAMWHRVENGRSSLIWATCLNPDVFKHGTTPENLEDYYKRAEEIRSFDYRRVFGIYPNTPKYQDSRKNTITWLSDHVERTRNLKHYQIRYVEMDFQAAEMWIDDVGISFSFPAALGIEAGWATTDQEAMETAKNYYMQLWERARRIEELLA